VKCPHAFPLDAEGLVVDLRRTLIKFGEENACDAITVDADGHAYPF
jgi:hypothetical protein